MDRYLLKDEEVAKKILATLLGPQSQFRKDNPKLSGILQNLIAKDVGSSVIELWLRNDKSDKLLHETIARSGSYEILRAIAGKCWRAVREQKPQSFTAHLAAALKATFPKRTFPDLSALHISFEYVVISILRKSMLTDDIPDNEMGQFKILKKDYFRVRTCLTDNKFYAFREKYISGASAFPSLPQPPPDTTLYYHFKHNIGENTIPGVLKSGLRAPRVQNYDDSFEEHLDFGPGFYTTTNPAEIMILVDVYDMGVVLVFAVPNSSGLTRYIWEGNEWVDCVKRYLSHNSPYPTKSHDLWEGAVSHNHHYVYQQDEDPVPSEKYQVVVKTAHGAQVFNNSLFAIIEWD